ncbi:MAG: hypothetical protein EOO48_00380 [Flavobacterium sp.]|nr:MAG: hypothetical protein EOO48_00380 [Flavobacterium sp.]
MNAKKDNRDSASSADELERNLNANNAYSGSGAMQPGGETGQSQDNPVNNLSDARQQADTMAGNPVADENARHSDSSTPTE